MTAVGFEPTQLALVELESTPLDHSGKLSCHVELQKISLKGWHPRRKQVVSKHSNVQYSLRGLNPRPMAHKTIALATELRELEDVQVNPNQRHDCERTSSDNLAFSKFGKPSYLRMGLNLRHQWSSGRIHRCHRCDLGSIAN